MSWGGETYADVKLGAENPKLLIVKLSLIVSDNYIGSAESVKDVISYEVFYLSFGPLCEVINYNNCITDLVFARRLWADQIKSPLGEGPKADHRSERLRMGVRKYLRSPDTCHRN
ncbi:hypothetical protein ACFX11_030610 [Malus domestica]